MRASTRSPMHDPSTLILSFGPFSLWHEDPCRGPGGDDSCGWFMRAHHGDKEMLAKIRKAIAQDFDRVFMYHEGDWDGEKERAGNPPKSIHYMGYFDPAGGMNFTLHGIVINMFFDAIHVYFGHDWNKSRPWMRRNLFDILMFAENPTDSLRDGIVGTFGIEKDRERRIDQYASCIYGWILREQRPWYRHPRWHVHHWRLNVSWWWFVPRWLDRKLRPESHPVCACENGVPTP